MDEVRTQEFTSRVSLGFALEVGPWICGAVSEVKSAPRRRSNVPSIVASRVGASKQGSRRQGVSAAVNARG